MVEQAKKSLIEDREAEVKMREKKKEKNLKGKGMANGGAGEERASET